MGYGSPRYPYRLYVTGTGTFNNYFLYRRYLNEYKTNKTFLYAPRHSTFEAMTRLYATDNNLCFLTCDVERGLTQFHNYTALGFKIAEVTDMLIAFWDGKSRGVRELEYAFQCRRKKSIIIDVSYADIVSNNSTLKHPSTDKIDFQSVYGKYIDEEFKSTSFHERAMKFLVDAYNNKELMKLIIDNKNKDIITDDPLGKEIRSLLFWIYNNVISEIEEDYNNSIKKESPSEINTSNTCKYKLAESCEWSEIGEEVPLYTGTGLLLATGYTTVFNYGDHTYVEIPERMLIRAHIHKSMTTRMYTENEDDCTKITYHTSDTESYPITYQVANFEDCLFKMGNFYINTDFVTKVKPIKKKVSL